jgi:hypothetical protein
LKSIRNTMIIFLVSGFWHGANWTFIVWGAFHALLFIPLLLLGRNHRYRNTVAEGRTFPNPKELLQMSVTFLLTLVGWIIFRAESIGQAVGYLQRICSRSLFSIPKMPGIDLARAGELVASTLCFIFILFATEWRHREREHGLSLHVKNQAMRYIIYIVLLWALLFFPAIEPAAFVYFQF